VWTRDNGTMVRLSDDSSVGTRKQSILKGTASSCHTSLSADARCLARACEWCAIAPGSRCTLRKYFGRARNPFQTRALAFTGHVRTHLLFQLEV
jgi:hypothetical protein